MHLAAARLALARAGPGGIGRSLPLQAVSSAPVSIAPRSTGRNSGPNRDFRLPWHRTAIVTVVQITQINTHRTRTRRRGRRARLGRKRPPLSPRQTSSTKQRALCVHIGLSGQWSWWDREGVGFYRAGGGGKGGRKGGRDSEGGSEGA